jgi:hypothetical protein
LTTSSDQVDGARNPYTSFSVRGSGLRLSNVRRHARTQAHQEAVIGYLLDLAGNAASKAQAEGPNLLAAAQPEFKNAWEDLRKGTKAARDRELAFLTAATCVSIMMNAMAAF